ncbi:MAG: 3-isopropylmalate dehydratase small subunit [Gammaproteobacteria bacterium]
MKQFTKCKGVVVPLDRANVDTDAIIPKQFLKSIQRVGFGPNLFDEWRYLDHGELGQDNSSRPLNPEFILNQRRYQTGQILLARDNFGCGSSREHAVWALMDYGFRVVIAPSFADIFYNNCFKNGLLPVVLDAEIVDDLFKAVAAESGYCLTVDLEAQQIKDPDRLVFGFEMDSYQKHCLLNGLDDIALTLQHTDDVRAYEERRRKVTPWLFPAS